jgi:predicted RNA-binding Zn ribbon-like protein
VEFDFVSDNRALDFAGTLLHRDSPQTRRDLLDRPTTLAIWVEAAGLVSRPIRVTREQFERAITLREATYRLAVACVDRTEPAPEDLAVVNEVAETVPPNSRLTAFGSVYHREDADAALAALARSAIDLLGSSQHNLISRCGGSDCTRLFVDRSHGRHRRWCNMQSCGNQAKVTAYRRRRHHDQAQPMPS